MTHHRNLVAMPNVLDGAFKLWGKGADQGQMFTFAVQLLKGFQQIANPFSYRDVADKQQSKLAFATLRAWIEPVEVYSVGHQFQFLAVDSGFDKSVDYEGRRDGEAANRQ